MDDDENQELLSIGAFARQVGLTPSALRFYDDCGALRPARVDTATGYRSYAAGQRDRAVRLRRLRAAGVPLMEVAVVLDGPEEAAHDVLRAHLERTREAAESAQEVVEAFARGATAGDRDVSAASYTADVSYAEKADGGGAARAWAPVRARVGGAELAGAVRQVAPSAAVGAARSEFPVLGCVLLEFVDGEVRLVATDRHRLAVRVLRATEFEGGPRRVLVDAAAAREWERWAVRQDLVDVEVAGDTGYPEGAGGTAESADGVGAGRGVRLRSGAGDLELPMGVASGGLDRPGGAAEFPDYRLILEGLGLLGEGGPSGQGGPSGHVGQGRWHGGSPATRWRVIVDRVGLRDALAGGAGMVTLEVGADAVGAGEAAGHVTGQELAVTGGERSATRLRAVCTGPAALRIAFDPGVLVPALEAGVGPDVLLEIEAADRPVVVRSADQGSFTTLVMPVREAGG